MAQTETPAEALHRIQSGRSNNDLRVIAAFEAQGYSDVRPRENVLTFHAWKAKGRQVKKGEKGTKVTTWIPVGEKKDEDGNVIRRAGSRPRTVALFHESQTKPMQKRRAAPYRATRKGKPQPGAPIFAN